MTVHSRFFRPLLPTLLVLAAARGANAQALPPPVDPYLPVAPPSHIAVPPPSPVAAELEARGRRKKIVGAVLMGVGLSVGVVGIGLAFDGALNAHCTGHEEHTTCTSSSATTELMIGESAAVMGNLLAIAGIPVYVVGAVQVAKARTMTTLTIQPLVSAAGPGAIARLEMRF